MRHFGVPVSAPVRGYAEGFSHTYSHHLSTVSGKGVALPAGSVRPGLPGSVPPVSLGSTYLKEPARFCFQTTSSVKYGCMVSENIPWPTCFAGKGFKLYSHALGRLPRLRSVCSGGGKAVVGTAPFIPFLYLA